jgi:hypothetical protein
MNAVRLHRRSATVVVFAMLMGMIQVPAWAAPPKASITINDVQVVEGNAGTKMLSFTARIKGRRSAGASVAWATQNGTAVAPDDYNIGGGIVSFANGKIQKVNVTVVGDQTDEPDETLKVNLSGAVNATISDAQGVGTIVDDDEAATLSISDDVVGEGNLGATTSASFDVTLSKPLTSPVSVGYATANGSATAGSDYTAKSDTLTFNPGQTAQSVVVDVLGDNLASEADETFAVNLSAPVGANIADGAGTGTIIDDEVLPAVSIDDATVTEGASASATFSVTLSHQSAEDVAVDYATTPGSASAPADFDAVNDVVVFPAGSTAQSIVVPVKDDALDEPTENFAIELSNHPKALAADVQGRGVILDNETVPRVSVRNLTVIEGSAPAGAVKVELSHGSSQDVVVAYLASDGSAKVTRDYGATVGAVTFNSGQLNKIVSVPVVNDQVSPSGASASQSTSPRR